MGAPSSWWAKSTSATEGWVGGEEDLKGGMGESSPAEAAAQELASKAAAQEKVAVASNIPEAAEAPKEVKPVRALKKSVVEAAPPPPLLPFLTPSCHPYTPLWLPCPCPSRAIPSCDLPPVSPSWTLQHPTLSQSSTTQHPQKTLHPPGGGGMAGENGQKMVETTHTTLQPPPPPQGCATCLFVSQPILVSIVAPLELGLGTRNPPFVACMVVEIRNQSLGRRQKRERKRDLG